MKNRGISLIVLIITIVVIIILSAAIILNLKGINIIDNARESVVKQDFKSFESELELYIADEYAKLEGKLDVTTIDATSSEEVAKIIPSIKGSKYEEYVMIVDGKIVLSDSMPEEQKEWVEEIISTGSQPPVTATPVFQSKDVVASVNSTFTGGDYASSNPVIPAGFKISDDGAKWKDTENDGIVDTWNDGLVIKDEIGNEFVWVPCTIDGTNGTIKYANNYTYPSRYVATAQNTSNDKDALPIINETEIDDKDQIKKYGGFYIGRYEAGVPENQTQINGNKGVSDVEGKPVIKKGSIVWTNISYVKASPSAKKLYKSSKSVKSEIINGTAWDTVCEWIQSEKDSEDNSIHDIKNSINWGNYNNDSVDGNNGKQNSGAKEEWKAKNIYDFAGNAWEWVAEIYNSDLNFRGGSYNRNSAVSPACYRYNFGPSYISDDISFRIMLYVL